MAVEQSKPAPPKRKRRWFQFSLRTLLLLVTLFSIPCFLVRQRIARMARNDTFIARVETINEKQEPIGWDREQGSSFSVEGRIEYDYEIDQATPVVDGYKVPFGPVWLRKMLGDHFFCEVASVSFCGSSFGDDELQIIRESPALETLELSYTHVTSRGLASLPARRSLTSLTIYKCSIGDDLFEWLQGCTALRELKLSFTKVTGHKIGLLRNLTKLKELDLENTPLDDEGMKGIGELASLENLDVADTQISDAGLAYLRRLPKLTGLDLNYTKISDRGLAQLGGHPALQWISLDGTGVNGSGFKCLATIPGLKSVSCQSDSVTDDSLFVLATAPSLETIDVCLQKTVISDDGVQRLKKRHPKLTVYVYTED